MLPPQTEGRCTDATRRVEVLLATFNGADHLPALLASLEAQTWPDWQLLVRDDLSEDNTLAIVSEWGDRNPGRLRVLASLGERLGPCGNFSRLLETTSAQYVAWCDQDDVWIQDRLALSIEAMLQAEAENPTGHPILVHTDLEVVDSNLKSLSSSFRAYSGLRAPKDAVDLALRNTVTGCTVTMNRALVNLASPVPAGAAMHDWWAAIVAATFGSIVSLDQATVRYRQHSANEIGAKRRSRRSAVRKALRFWDATELREGMMESARQADAFEAVFGERIPNEVRVRLRSIATLSEQSAAGRRWSLFRYRLFAGTVFDRIGQLVRV